MVEKEKVLEDLQDRENSKKKQKMFAYFEKGELEQ